MTVVELGGGATVPFKAQMPACAIAFKASAEPDGRAVIGLLHGDALDVDGATFYLWSVGAHAGRFIGVEDI